MSKSKVRSKITKPIKITPIKQEKKKIIIPECNFQSEKKCKSKSCDICLFCNRNYCDKHMLDHVSAAHKHDPQFSNWLQQYMKNEYENKLAKLQEKYSEYISD